MLVYFSVENFKSIKHKLELDMRTAPRLRRLPHHAYTAPKNKSLKLLRSAVMYGANASGKSNVIKAMRAAQVKVTRDTDGAKFGKIEPFLLGEELSDETTFQFEFMYSGNHFAYGFSIEKGQINSEYYYYLSKNIDFCFFERTRNSDGEFEIRTDIEADKNYQEEDIKDLIMLIKYCPDDTLFLNECEEKQYYQKIDSIGSVFLPVIYFFFVQLIIIFPTTTYGEHGKDLAQEDRDSKYLELISKFDTGISEIKTKNIELSKFPERLIEHAKDLLDDRDRSSITINYNDQDFRFEYSSADSKELVASKLISIHKLKSGKEIIFELSQESDGTKRLMDLLPALACHDKDEEAESRANFTFVIDEFDRSLHPNVSREFLDLFLNKNLETSENQLIVTTHESSLLDSELLRRDEVWFIQKEYDQSTILYSLNDYSPRFDKDIRSAYLSGTFGAIPNFKRW